MLVSMIVFILFLLLLYAVFIKPYKEIDKLPGPSTIELIRNYSYYSSRKGIIAYLQTLNRKYGPVVKVWIKPLKPMIITTDPEYVERILKSNDLHINPTLFKMIFMRNGIASMPDCYVIDDVWKKDKQLINKAITKEYIARKLSVYDEKYNKFINIVRENLGKPFDVEAPLHQIILEIMMYTMKATNVELTEQEIQSYYKYRKDFFGLLLEQMNSFRMMGVLHKFNKNYKLLNDNSNKIINFGRIWLERFKNVSAELRDKHNLVYAMIHGGMPEDRIVDNINTMIQGGHDTTIIPLALGFCEMSRRPEIQQKIFDEIHSVLGTDKTTPVTPKDLDKMVYLHAFVKESLRRYMSLPYLARTIVCDTEIKGVKIPKNMTVMFHFPGILLSEEYYEDPFVFNPDRFLRGNLTPRARKGFICFASGLKTCPGKNIAYAAMKLLIVKILREFEICPFQEDRQIQLIAEVFFRSVHGIPVVFKTRNW